MSDKDLETNFINDKRSGLKKDPDKPPPKPVKSRFKFPKLTKLKSYFASRWATILATTAVCGILGVATTTKWGKDGKDVPREVKGEESQAREETQTTAGLQQQALRELKDIKIVEKEVTIPVIKTVEKVIEIPVIKRVERRVSKGPKRTVRKDSQRVRHSDKQLEEDIGLPSVPGARVGGDIRPPSERLENKIEKLIRPAPLPEKRVAQETRFTDAYLASNCLWQKDCQWLRAYPYKIRGVKYVDIPSILARFRKVPGGWEHKTHNCDSCKYKFRKGFYVRVYKLGRGGPRGLNRYFIPAFKIKRQQRRLSWNRVKVMRY